jgi:hypothetical protein
MSAMELETLNAQAKCSALFEHVYESYAEQDKGVFSDAG